MINGPQIERARKLLGWDRTLLARRAGNLMTANAIVRDRVLDLSRGAARALGVAGIEPVTLLSVD
jgi:hypothetical protein